MNRRLLAAMATLSLGACAPFPKALRPSTWVGTLGVLHLIVFVWALVDILESDRKSSGTKVLWILVVLFFPLLGLIFYVLSGRD